MVCMILLVGEYVSEFLRNRGAGLSYASLLVASLVLLNRMYVAVACNILYP